MTGRLPSVLSCDNAGARGAGRNLLKTILYPGQSSPVSRLYDDAGRLHTVTDWLSPANTTTFGWDVDSNLTTIQFPNTTGGAAVVDTYVFDKADRLVNPTAGQPAVTFAVGGSNYAAITYGRDSNGQVNSEAATGLPGSAHLPVRLHGRPLLLAHCRSFRRQHARNQRVPPRRDGRAGAGPARSAGSTRSAG